MGAVVWLMNIHDQQMWSTAFKTSLSQVSWDQIVVNWKKMWSRFQSVPHVQQVDYTLANKYRRGNPRVFNVETHPRLVQFQLPASLLGQSPITLFVKISGAFTAWLKSRMSKNIETRCVTKTRQFYWRKTKVHREANFHIGVPHC